MRSPATTSWTWRRRPMFASALTSRSTPLWRSVCSTRSRPPCRSPGPRSRRRNGRHRSLPAPRRLRFRSPVPVPSTDRLISRPDPAVPGLRVAVGDPAHDEPAGETAVPSISAVRVARMAGRWRRRSARSGSTRLGAGWPAPRTVSCSDQGRSVACSERLTVWQASAGVAGRRIRSSPSPVPAGRSGGSKRSGAFLRLGRRPRVALQGHMTYGIRARRFAGYSGNCWWYQAWWSTARGARFATV
jgi:hypothetical protein